MVNIKEMSWVASNNMDAGMAEVGRKSTDVSPSTVNLQEIHLSIFSQSLVHRAKKLLHGTPILLFRQLHMGII